MALSLRRGVVTDVVERVQGLVRLEVDGLPCVAYPRLTGEVEEGDDVVVNEGARLLGLGSGGFDVLHANLTRGLGLPQEGGAHVMKLPYTPLQFAVRHAEEDVELPTSVEELRIVCCSVHSQLAPVCAALGGLRVAYVQLEGGALPVALSDSVRVLRERGLLAGTVGVGACFGGDVDCVNAFSALAWVRSAGFDAAVCAVGPGIVGTASALGHGGMAAGVAAAAAVCLEGRPVLALRISHGDPRERHRGVSHHTLDVLGLDGPGLRFAWPEGLDPRDEVEEALAESAEWIDASAWRDACAGLPLSHMRRGGDDDPWFFAAAYAAGLLARG